MTITKTKIDLTNDNGVLAYVSVVFDNCFCVRHIRIIETVKGLLVSMPNRKRNRADGNFTHEDLAFPINKLFRRYIVDVILREYEQAMSDKSPS